MATSVIGQNECQKEYLPKCHIQPWPQFLLSLLKFQRLESKHRNVIVNDMCKLGYLFLILVMAFCPLVLSAQDDEVMMELRAGHNAVFGGFAAVSIITDKTFCGDFSVRGGVQYNTIGKTTLEACPAYNMSFEWGRLSAEAILEYSNLSSINNFAIGAGASLDSRSLSARLGYYYRLYCGKGGEIKEPFNVYYELRAHLLKKVINWNLDLVITNCGIFELERHFQPSFIAEGRFYPTSKLGISFGIGCKPSGMFNMSADYYQSYLKTGVCYRW